MPVGNCKIECRADFGLIEHRECGTLHLAGELAAVAGIHLAGASCQLADGYGKVIPGAYALVAVMVYTFCRLRCVDDGADGICQVAGIGGGTHLVEDHIETGAAGHETEHGLHEILAMYRIQPRCADDDAAAAAVDDGLFTGKLGAAVSSKRVGGQVFGAGGVALAAEHVVRAHMHQQCAFGLGCGSQIGCCRRVDEVGYIFLVFRCIHIGVGSAVHDSAYSFGSFQYSCCISDVELSHIGKDELMLTACLCGHAAHFAAQLTVGTCYENFHDLRF